MQNTYSIHDAHSILIESPAHFRTSWRARCRRLWFVLTAVPRYIWSGRVQLPF